MTSESIINSSVLDIVFEKRNKDYGAYRLRKYYNNRLVKSLAIMTGTVVIFSAFSLLPESSKPIEFQVEETGFVNFNPNPKPMPPKSKPIKQPLVKAVSTIHLSSTISIVNTKDSADVLHNLDDKAIGSENNEVPGDRGGALIGAINQGGNGNSIETLKDIETLVDIEQPVNNPDVMPSYPGGIEALRRFLIKNLRNPRDLEEGELITVKVRFVVGYDGQQKSFDIAQDGGAEFNNEVIRVLKKMPVWIPGKSKGQNVPVYYTIPVKFIPED